MDVKAVIISLSAKFFPLRTPLFNLHNFRFQPYVVGGVGAALVPLELRGSYTYSGETSAVEVDLTEGVGLWNFGAGVDMHFSRRVGVFVDAQWISLFAEPQFRIVFTPTNTERKERLDIDALMVRLGLKIVF